MSNQFIDNNNDDERKSLRAQRIEAMKRSKKRQEIFRKAVRKYVPVLGIALCLLLLVFLGIKLFYKTPALADSQEEASGETNRTETEVQEEIQENIGTQAGNQADNDTGETEQTAPNKEDTEQKPVYTAAETADTIRLGEDIVSSYAVMLDLSTDTICAQKGAKTVISPASMTKILTVLVAAEQVTDLEDTFTITTEITDYAYVNDCSTAGFADGETVTVRDLFYGTILPSGGEAALGLAVYVAGSQEAFAELMNDKLDELGLSDTAHFTNCIGLYDEAHHCTVYDMAVILKAALENELCKEVLSAHTYTTSSTPEHPEGIIISNWFLRRIEDKDSGGEVVCGKTGYVVQSKNCAASYGVNSQGKAYICVTAGASSGWRCIYDHVALYQKFMS